MCRSTSLCKASRWASSKSTLLRFTISQMGPGQFLIHSGDSLLGRSGSTLSSLSSATSITGVQSATFMPRLIVSGSVLTFNTRTGRIGPSVFTRVRPMTKPRVDCPAGSSARPQEPCQVGCARQGAGPSPRHPGE